MEKTFFKFAPVIVALIGILLWALNHLLDRYTGLDSRWIWLPWLGTQAVFGLVCGRIIQKLHQGGHRDALTGLKNRRYFYDKLSEEIERAKRGNTPLSLIMIDVDDFKKVNDKYGHNAGDEVLKQIAALLASNIRVIDTVARWGGEEFAVILPATGREGALTLAERLRVSIESAHLLLQTTISLGVLSAGSITNADDFVMQADNALFKAKKKKNSVVAV